MKTKEFYLADFEEGSILHIFNRTNNKELLFNNELDKQLFLNRYQFYLFPFLDTFSWTLIPNHFHLIVRVKKRQEIVKHLESLNPAVLKKVEKEFLLNEETMEHLIELEWIRFLTSYAMRFNLIHGRNGNLFYRPFKRILVEDDEYFRQAVLYIHTNPCKHHICSDIENYEWSSYSSLLKSDLTNPIHQEIMLKFGGRDAFISSHELKVQLLLTPAVDSYTD
jgi:putative transposase